MRGSPSARSAHRSEPVGTSREHLGLGPARVELGQHLALAVGVGLQRASIACVEHLVRRRGLAVQAELEVEAPHARAPRDRRSPRLHRLAMGGPVLAEGRVGRHAAGAPPEARGDATDARRARRRWGASASACR